MLLPFTFLLLPLAVVAQDAATLQTIQTDLTGLGLTKMASFVKAAGSTFQLGVTSSNPRTLFAPTDDALVNASNSDPLLLYMLTTGGIWTVDKLGTGPNHSILTTSLTGNHLIFLENNRPAVIACGNPQDDGKIEIYNQNAPTTVTKTQVNTKLNIAYHVLNRIPDFPFNYPSWVSVLGPTWQSIARSSGNSDDTIGAMLGYTFFVFSDGAYQRDLSTHLSNVSALDIFNNHVIPGKTIFYNTFETQTYTTAGGNELKFSLNKNTLEYTVSIGLSSALITRSDITTANGVIHVIDGTLWDVHPTVTTASPTGTVGPTGTSSATTAPGIVTTSLDQQEGASSSSKSSPSGGAIAGIVIGAIAAVAILLAAFWFLWRRKQRNNQNQWDEKDPNHPHTVEPFTAVTQQPLTASSWSAGQPQTPYGRYTMAPSVVSDELSGSSDTSPINPTPVFRSGKHPLPSPGVQTHHAADSVSTNTAFNGVSTNTAFNGGQVPDHVVDHILERLAARIDRNDPTGTQPPTYSS